jgi:hypothetical protein
MGQFNVGRNNFLKVDELIDTRGGTAFQSDGDREYFRKFHVIVDRKEIGASVICALAPGLPAPFSPYLSPDGIEFDEFALLVNKSAVRLDSTEFFHWIVTCQYSTQVPEGGVPELMKEGAWADGAQNKPWLMRPHIEWDWEEFTHYPSRDLDGKAYVNSADMPFAPAPGFPAARAILVVRRNEPSFSREIASRYAYSVNRDLFLGAKPGCVQSLPPRGVPRNRGPLQYYEITYRLRFGLPLRHDPTGLLERILDRAGIERKVLELQPFQPELLDQGTHEIQRIAGVPFTGRPVPIIRYGQVVNRDVLLDGSGKEAKRNANNEIVPTFLRFREFHAVPFRPIIEKGIFGGIVGGI